MSFLFPISSRSKWSVPLKFNDISSYFQNTSLVNEQFMATLFAFIVLVDVYMLFSIFCIMSSASMAVMLTAAVRTHLLPNVTRPTRVASRPMSSRLMMSDRKRIMSCQLSWPGRLVSRILPDSSTTSPRSIRHAVRRARLTPWHFMVVSQVFDTDYECYTSLFTLLPPNDCLE